MTAKHYIWKYQLNRGSEGNSLVMPKDAQILTVQIVDGIPCLYASVDPAAHAELRKFQLVATGEPYERSNKRYIGTIQLVGLPVLVFHVFELLTEKQQLLADLTTIIKGSR